MRPAAMLAAALVYVIVFWALGVHLWNSIHSPEKAGKRIERMNGR